jgi:putative membrane protein
MMSLSLTTVIALVALIQGGISVVETFLWNELRVHGRLNFTGAEAKKVAPIFANAGLYNSFLAAGCSRRYSSACPKGEAEGRSLSA